MTKQKYPLLAPLSQKQLLSYIAIRSKKHLLSIAYTHGRDIKHFLSWRNFKKIVRSGNSVKSIGMIFCDGGPDENNFNEAPPLT